MSSFTCSECGAEIIDTRRGYVTECEHWPLERKILGDDPSLKKEAMTPERVARITEYLRATGQLSR